MLTVSFCTACGVSILLPGNGNLENAAAKFSTISSVGIMVSVIAMDN